MANEIGVIRSEYPEEFLNCRSWGHAWALATMQQTKLVRTPITLVVLGCARCKMERRDLRNRQWELVERTYKFPQGYHVKGRVPRADASREVARRYFATVG